MKKIYGFFIPLVLSMFVFSCSITVFAHSSAESAWQSLAGKNAQQRPAFAYVKNNPALPNVLIYGDSISIAYTPHVRKHFDGRANIYRLYRNGSDSGSFIKYMTAMHKVMTNPELEQSWGFEWDVIHFNVGLHDLKYVANGKLDKTNGQLKTSIDVYKKNLVQIVGYLKQLAPKAKLIFATTTPVPKGELGRFSGDAKKYNDAALDVLDQYKDIQINDLYSLSKMNHPAWWIKAGDVHYNDLGIAAQGDKVSLHIESALTELSKKN